MAKELKTVTIRISNEDADYLNELGEGFINRGINALLAKMRVLTTQADNEIKGMFTEAEWKFLADSMNGIMIDETLRYSAQNLAYHNEDAQTYDKTADKWDVDLQVLNKKILALSSAQVDAVYRRVERFWEQSPDIDAWARY